MGDVTWDSDTLTLIITAEGTLQKHTENQAEAVHIKVLGNVLYVADHALLNYKNLKTVEFPDSVIEFGNSVVDNSKIKSIHIPLNCKKLATSGSFDWIYTLEKFTIDEDNQYFRVLDGVLYDKNMTVLFSYPYARNNSIYTVPYGITSLYSSSMPGLIHLQHLIIPQTLINSTYIYYASQNTINITIYRYKDQFDSVFNEAEQWLRSNKKNYYINYVHEEYYATYYPSNNTVNIFTTGRDHSIHYQDLYFSNVSDIKYVHVGRGIKSLDSRCFANSTDTIYYYSNEVFTPYLCRKTFSFKFVSVFIAITL